MKHIFFLTFLGIFIYLIYNFFHYHDLDNKLSIRDSYVHTIFEKAKEQKSDKIVMDNSFTLLKEIKIENFVLKPLLLRVDENQNIFVLDRYQQRIYVFQNDNKAVIEIGHGKGQGPKEFLNITDFRVKNDSVYITDPYLKKIGIFLINGKYIKSIPVENGALSIAIFNHILAYKTFSHQNYLFGTIDLLSGKENRLIDSQQLNAMDPLLMSGIILKENQNNFIFVFREIGMFFSYDMKNKSYKIIRKTILSNGIPKIQISTNGILKLSRKRKLACYSAANDNIFLYILRTIIKEKEKYYALIDIYKKDTGDYIKTYKFQTSKENPITSIYVFRKLIYCLTPYSIQIYTRG
jgi:hypothetical protein